MRAAVFVISFSIAILALLPGRVAAVQNVNFEWIASPSPAATGYNIHYGLESGVYTDKVPVGTNTSATISGLVEGLTYYFVVTAYDSAGDESDPSNEIGYTVPGIAPPGNPSVQDDPTSGGTILKWKPSPSPNVAGYDVYCGTASGSHPTLIFSGDATALALPDQAPETTCYFVVTAYDFDGLESAATPEVFHTAPPVVAPLPALSLQRRGQTSALTTPNAVAVPAPVLSLQQAPAAGLTGVFSITASGAIPPAWALEASSDLRAWGTLTTGSNSAVNVTVAISPKPRLFFRLGSSLPNIQMRTQTPPDAFPKSFRISTAETAPAAWTIQASEDLQVWSRLTSGTNAPVNVAVVTADVPQLFFRLKSL